MKNFFSLETSLSRLERSFNTGLLYDLFPSEVPSALSMPDPDMHVDQGRLASWQVGKLAIHDTYSTTYSKDHIRSQGCFTQFQFHVSL